MGMGGMGMGATPVAAPVPQMGAPPMMAAAPAAAANPFDLF